MNPNIVKIIENINKGIIPEGYKKTKVGIVPVEWEIKKLSEIMHNEQRAVNKPNEPYIRVGIRSHAKGTFHELVENPVEVNMDILYVVKKDDLILNITFAWEHAIALADENDDGKLVSHRFPTYVFDNNSPAYYKYVFCQDMFRQRLELISPGGAGRNRVLNKTDFLNLEIFCPPLPEQQKIAEILSTQDKLIELQERKIEQLKTLKKGYLQKMFPKKGAKSPELRFKGFTEPWEKRKFSEIADSRRGLTYKPSNISERGVRVLRSSNINEDTFVFGNDDVFVEESAVNIPYVNDGDILITSANGSTRLVGKHTIIRDLLQNPTIHGGFMIVASSKNPDFLNASMSSCWYSQFISLYVSGGNGSIGNLNKNDLDMQIVLVPNEEEQQQIGSYFRTLDRLITLHQYKLDKEKQKKKALMQLLLTGKVRVST